MLTGLMNNVHTCVACSHMQSRSWSSQGTTKNLSQNSEASNRSSQLTRTTTSDSTAFMKIHRGASTSELLSAKKGQIPISARAQTTLAEVHEAGDFERHVDIETANTERHVDIEMVNTEEEAERRPSGKDEHAPTHEV